MKKNILVLMSIILLSISLFSSEIISVEIIPQNLSSITGNFSVHFDMQGNSTLQFVAGPMMPLLRANFFNSMSVITHYGINVYSQEEWKLSFENQLRFMGNSTFRLYATSELDIKNLSNISYNWNVGGMIGVLSGYVRLGAIIGEDFSIVAGFVY